MTVLGPGVKVKCVKRNEWRIVELGNIIGSGPTFGSVWTVERVMEDPPFTSMYLVEWPEYNSEYHSAFDVRWFIPLEGNENLSALLAALNIHKAIVGNDDIAVSAPELDEVEAK